MNTILDLNSINYTPEYPLDIDGWNNDSTIFKDLISAIKPKVIIEVGTWKGQSTFKMADIIKDLNLETKIYCIDTWLGSEEFLTILKDTKERNLLLKNGYPQVYYQFLSNVFHTKNQDIIIPIPTTSNIGAKILKFYNIEPDLIYVDASHSYQDVSLDLENYYNLLKPNGVIFGDDFNNNWPSVKDAVFNYCRDKRIEFEVLDEKWLIRK